MCNGNHSSSRIFKKGDLIIIDFFDPDCDNKFDVPSVVQIDYIEDDGLILAGIPIKFICLKSIKVICPSCGQDGVE